MDHSTSHWRLRTEWRRLLALLCCGWALCAAGCLLEDDPPAVVDAPDAIASVDVAGLDDPADAAEGDGPAAAAEPADRGGPGGDHCSVGFGSDAEDAAAEDLGGATGPDDGEVGSDGAAGTEADVADPLEPPPEPEHLFDDATEALGLAGLKSSSISIADIDGDGLDDLLVGGNLGAGGPPTEAYRYTSSGVFEPVDLATAVNGPGLIQDVSATSVADLDRDGRPEIILGGYYGGHVQVLWNLGDLQFALQDVFQSAFHAGTKVTGFEVWDFNGDAFPDIFASMKLPSSKITAWTKTHSNILLANSGNKSFINTYDDLYDTLICGRKQTFSSFVLPGAALGRPDVLYVANDMSRNCAWEVTPDFPLPSFSVLSDPDKVVEQLGFSMGADFMYEDDTGDVQLIVTDIGVHKAYQINADGIVAVEGLDLDHGSNYYGWGIALFDADNDGDQDAVVATGVTSTNEQVTSFAVQTSPYDDVILHSRIHYFERQDDGTFQSANDLAGPAFAAESGEWYSVSRADFDQDGCVDVVVGVRQAFDGDDFFNKFAMYSADKDTYALLAPGLRVLKNNCKPSKNRWVGLRVPDLPGTLVALQRSDGVTVFDSVRGTVGVGSRSGGGLLHFGLGETLEAVKATVYHPNGVVIATLGPLEAGHYHTAL